MIQFRSVAMSVVALAGLLLTASAGQADVVYTGILYFTTFSGSSTDRVHSVAYTYNSTTPSFTLSSVHDITTNQGIGADGIIFAPDGTLLIGGQSSNVFNVNPFTGNVIKTITNTGGGTVYHLALAPNLNTIYGGGTEGGTQGLVKDSLSAGTGSTLAVTGSNTAITGIAFDATGNAFYTSSGDSGGGNFGTLTGLSTNTPVTTALDNLTAAHGIVYDPFTGDFILVGGDEIAQVTPSGTVVSTRTFSGYSSSFDQASVDGLGHLFVANNDGNMLFVDYSSTGLVGDLSNLTSKNFLDDNLDDLAPLVGLGGSTSAVPEPSSMVLLGMGGLGLLGYRLRRRWRA